MQAIIHRADTELPPVGVKLVLHIQGKSETEVVKAVVPNRPKQTPETQEPVGDWIQGLEWENMMGYCVPIRKTDCWSHTDERLIAMEQELADTHMKLAQMTAIAAYLADCHAATAEDVGGRKSSTKHARKRHKDICVQAVAMLKSGYYIGPYMNGRYQTKESIDGIIKRCADASIICEETKP